MADSVLWVDIRDFGGEPGLPCHVALHRAIEVIPPEGAVIYFPPGNWRINGVFFEAPVGLRFESDEEKLNRIEITNCAFMGGTLGFEVDKVTLEPRLRILPPKEAPPPPPEPEPEPEPFPVPHRDGRSIELDGPVHAP